MRDPARILVVDDVADNVEILRMRLSSLGYEVVVAEDGEQALAKVRETLPDLVLLDIMMPKIDGLEVVRRMKADATLPFIPVILVTAKAGQKDVLLGSMPAATTTSPSRSTTARWWRGCAPCCASRRCTTRCRR